MDFEIYKDGELVNTIHASLEFTMAYCKAEGYTFKQMEEPEPEVTEMEKLRADIDFLAALEGIVL